MWPQQLTFFLLVCVTFCVLFYYVVNSNDDAIRLIIGPSILRSQKELNLTEVEVDFLRSGLTRRHNLFIIQPSILIQLLEPRDLTALVKNRLLPISATNYSGNILSLGYKPKNNLHNVCSSLFDYNLTNWNCSAHPVREPFHEINYTRTESLITSLIGHYVLINGDSLIHVTVFHEQENYLWVDQLIDQDSEKFIFGLNSRHLYDHFTVDITYVDLENGQFLPINVPSEAWYFLSQVETSTFVPCNHKMAAKWTGGRASDTFLRLGEDAIVAMTKLTKQLRINFWLDSGTLLGWYRQCDVIPYTDDYDFATWARYIEPTDGATFRSNVQQELIDIHSVLELSDTYGHPGEAYEMAFRHEGIKLDLFFAYETEQNHQIGGHVVQNNTYFYYVYPKWTLCSAILLGYKVLAHCDSERTLRSVYGDHFSEPVKSFHWATEPFNMGPLHTWPPDSGDTYWHY